jgi:hypothetical protein
MERRRPALARLGALAAALLAAGCGSSSSSVNTTATSTTSTVAAAAATHASSPKPHLRIVSPRGGALTGRTVTVRVAANDVPLVGARSVRYVLNGGRPRLGSGRYTLSGLAPGRYRLVATLADDRSVKATRVFTVLAPPPAPAPAPVSAPTRTTTQTQVPASTPAPAQTTTSPPPPQPPPAPPSSGIPQHNGGDMDSDNNGGPSDGDGNI